MGLVMTLEELKTDLRQCAVNINHPPAYARTVRVSDKRRVDYRRVFDPDVFEQYWFKIDGHWIKKAFPIGCWEVVGDLWQMDYQAASPEERAEMEYAVEIAKMEVAEAEAARMEGGVK